LVETNENKEINLGYGLGWGLLDSPYGQGSFKEGHAEGFQHYSIIFPEKQIGIIILSNSDNAESIFKELLEVTIGDTLEMGKLYSLQLRTIITVYKALIYAISYIKTLAII